MDPFPHEVRSKIMSKIRSVDTAPEIKLRKALWSAGVRYRKQYGGERVDIAFPSRKLAVFVDGCFWHSCPIHGHMPKSNADYWKRKLEANAMRAQEKDKRLTSQGWKIIHIWEHSIRSGLGSCLDAIASALLLPE